MTLLTAIGRDIPTLARSTSGPPKSNLTVTLPLKGFEDFFVVYDHLVQKEGWAVKQGCLGNIYLRRPRFWYKPWTWFNKKWAPVELVAWRLLGRTYKSEEYQEAAHALGLYPKAGALLDLVTFNILDPLWGDDSPGDPDTYFWEPLDLYLRLLGKEGESSFESTS